MTPWGRVVPQQGINVLYADLLENILESCSRERQDHD